MRAWTEDFVAIWKLVQSIRGRNKTPISACSTSQRSISGMRDPASFTVTA
jgi:3-oxoacyl-(acyl-carrier-protein) synthase